MAKEKRALPEILEQDFIICDNTLNRKGWRLLVEGIDMEGFLKNPVCITEHNMKSIPVGRWKNLRVEGEKFLGTLEFDKNDELAVTLYWKYKDGFMNAVSISVVPIEESEQLNMLVAGQRYPTLIKSELWEISIVTVPGQKNAVKLCTPEGGDYKLNVLDNKKENQMNKDEKDKSSEEDLQKKLDAANEKNVANLVKLHVQRGVVADGEVESLKKLALQDYDTVEKMLDARTPAKKEEEMPDGKEKEEEGKKLANELRKLNLNSEQGKSPKSKHDDWTFYDYFRKDPKALDAMRENEPEKYKQLEADFALQADASNLVYNPKKSK
ncbi:MAG: hypothetical protein FWC10_03605 [Lentimicrobiaceae bacterium]|nr:hypothetical protein [Lentimicrobiaceae bacterium]MCL2246181.1 hypothetical protein [Lentimicrobiaceae bacterium]